MISRSEHLVNALIQRMTELKEGKHGALEEMAFTKVMMHIFDVTKKYSIDRTELLNLFGLSNLTPQEIKVISELDYENNSPE